VVSVLTTVLFYWRILPVLVRAIAWLLSRTLGVGGAVGLSTAANIFVGMVEAPLFIRPYLQKLTRSELFVVMTGGMAGIAGTVLVLYATFLARSVPDAFGHLLVASILGAPAAILIARIMVPETAEARTDAELGPLEPVAESTMDAIVKGTLAGVELLINVVAMLLVFIALVHLVNGVLGFATGQAITLQQLLGYAMAPLCWAMGLPWHEAVTAGALMGVKTVLNEFVAYLDLAALPTEALSPRSRLIMTYALCGFANFGSLGIMIGGLATLAPARRAEIVGLGFKSIVSGTLTTCLLGGIAGLVV
jgi:CNT family concentrative nucleoside transporter